jgi:hypothetical protein
VPKGSCTRGQCRRQVDSANFGRLVTSRQASLKNSKSGTTKPWLIRSSFNFEIPVSLFICWWNVLNVIINNKPAWRTFYIYSYFWNMSKNNWILTGLHFVGFFLEPLSFKHAMIHLNKDASQDRHRYYHHGCISATVRFFSAENNTSLFLSAAARAHAGARLWSGWTPIHEDSSVDSSSGGWTSGQYCVCLQAP